MKGYEKDFKYTFVSYIYFDIACADHRGTYSSAGIRNFSNTLSCTYRSLLEEDEYFQVFCAWLNI